MGEVDRSLLIHKSRKLLVDIEYDLFEPFFESHVMRNFPFCWHSLFERRELNERNEISCFGTAQKRVKVGFMIEDRLHPGVVGLLHDLVELVEYNIDLMNQLIGENNSFGVHLSAFFYIKFLNFTLLGRDRERSD